MKNVKIISKTSNLTKAMIAGGLFTMGVAATKHFAFDKKAEPVEGEAPAKEILGFKPVTFGIGVTGAALTVAGLTKGTIEVIKANKALAAPDELPEVANPAAEA